MALSFTNSSDRVNIGTGSSLDNLATCTIAAWLYCTNDNIDRRIWQKGLSPNGRLFYTFSSAGTAQLRLDVHGRGTLAYANTSAFSAWATNKWCFAACVWNTGGANGDQKLYVGDLSTTLAEPSAYTSQAVGTGSPGNNSGVAAVWANNTNNASAFQGRIATGWIFNRVLSIGELAHLQFKGQILSGCVDYHEFGFTGSSSSADWSGNVNTGTITGATVVDHVPLASPFGFDEENPYAVSGGGGGGTVGRGLLQSKLLRHSTARLVA